ncbi:endo alpha-1,4 polygalactosaminidase [Schlegelella sp. S2-27]|uniref:Endo alpha-1,4 polygalactosaminidase n=1 Tax=Caldimonas mangrovi TaxID=2944811 RepID=A0ABT0YTY2_9BURK|nr:endo alpha-1,4 polygalactosaminidase [Caldimonas mangrovi]MCM5682210.1 endo alpha-1,4 polygalactosaminidase [Caldimonas mangrovi]
MKLPTWQGPFFRRCTRVTTAWLVATALASCGGGGGGGNSHPEPPAGVWWRPAVDTTWQWQLTGTLQTAHDVAMYDVDLFETSAAAIAGLQSAGRKVVCYFSAGSSEDWRDDHAQFEAADQGNPLDEWPGERWLDVRSSNVRRIMSDRLELAKTKGCDGVEPDNVEGYTHATGFAFTAQDQLDFNRYLAEQAHQRGLAIGLKNDIAQLAALEPHFDFAVNEQCHEYDECGSYAVFTSNGKPVFNAEYLAVYRDNTGGARDALCTAARAADLRTLVLPLALDGSFRHSCDATP